MPMYKKIGDGMTARQHKAVIKAIAYLENYAQYEMASAIERLLVEYNIMRAENEPKDT